ncbi:MAG: protoporphyrinogen/coproporphyrinogen oxidase [Ferrimicrobium sp.]
MNAVVIGGGISGLVACLSLAENGLDVTLIDSTSSLGGKIATASIGPAQVERGPDSFLTRAPETNRLIDSLGLTDQLIHPAVSLAALWVKGARHPFPSGHTLGAPTSPRAALRAHVLGVAPRVRGAWGAQFYSRQVKGDDLGLTVRKRYGNTYAETLIDPLVGGINANTIDGLSIKISAPAIASLASMPPTAPSNLPLFTAPVNGLSSLVDRLTARLLSLGVTIRTACAANSVDLRNRAAIIDTSDGPLEADHVIIATPADQAARLLQTSVPGASRLLGSIRYSSVSMALAYFDEPIPTHLRDLSGVLVPKRAHFLTTAVSIASNKWPTWLPSGGTLLRLSTGSLYDRRHLQLNNGDLIDLMLAEARMILGWNAVPSETALVRWPNAFPFFQPFHADLTSKIVATTTPHQVHLAGAYLHGSGIPTCIKTGLEAAKCVLGS